MLFVISVIEDGFSRKIALISTDHEDIGPIEIILKDFLHYVHYEEKEDFLDTIKVVMERDSDDPNKKIYNVEWNNLHARMYEVDFLVKGIFHF